MGNSSGNETSGSTSGADHESGSNSGRSSSGEEKKPLTVELSFNDSEDESGLLDDEMM